LNKELFDAARRVRVQLAEVQLLFTVAMACFPAHAIRSGVHSFRILSSCGREIYDGKQE
jgi:hypothetical protein